MKLLTLLALLVLVACASDPPLSTPILPTDTPIPAATPVPPSSLDEYLASCGELAATEIDFDKYNSKQEFLADLDTNIKQIEAMQPPPEVADFHNTIVAMQKAAKQALEDAPALGQEESLATYLVGILSGVGVEYQSKMMTVVDAMDEDIADRMREADCI